MGTVAVKSAKPLTSVRKTYIHTLISSVLIQFTFAVKCELPSSLQDNVIINGSISPALENNQIFLSCSPGYGFPHRKIISTCTSEAVWSPDFSLLDLECQHKSINNRTTIGDCGQLSLLSGVYRILNQTIDISYSAGSLVEFQCVHTPYHIDPLFTTQCQAGLWNPHPRDVCSQDLTVVGYG